MKGIKFFWVLFIIVVSATAFADINDDLLRAAANGEVAGVKELIDKGADVNATYDANEVYVKAYGRGTTVLMMAAINGSVEITKLLLDKGAMLDVKNEQGMTALSFAEKNGRNEIAKMFTAVSPAMADQDQKKKTDIAEKKPAASAQIIPKDLNVELAKKGLIGKKTDAVAKDKSPMLLALNLEGSQLALLSQKEIEAKVGGKKPMVLAQNALVKKVDYQVNATDLTNLPKISLEEMNEMVIKTETYEGLRKIYTKEADGRDFCYEHRKIPVPGQNWGVVPILAIGISDLNTPANGLAIKYINVSGQETAEAYDFVGFASIYKYATGRELKWAKVVGEPVQDPKYGTYVNVFVVPLSGPYTSIERDTLVMGISYADGQLDKPALFIIK